MRRGNSRFVATPSPPLGLRECTLLHPLPSPIEPLLADADADDLVQDAWLLALRKGWRDEPLSRAWLARVMRNLTLRRSEARRHRADRERAAAREEAVDDAAHLAEVGRYGTAFTSTTSAGPARATRRSVGRSGAFVGRGRRVPTYPTRHAVTPDFTPHGKRRQAPVGAGGTTP